jgi:hypothetical protein
MWYGFCQTRFVFSIPSPRLGDRKHTSWIHIISHHKTWEILYSFLQGTFQSLDDVFFFSCGPLHYIIWTLQVDIKIYCRWCTSLGAAGSTEAHDHSEVSVYWWNKRNITRGWQRGPKDRVQALLGSQCKIGCIETFFFKSSEILFH